MSKQAEPQVATTKIVNRENYFGGCPFCGGTDGFLNRGRHHWFLCAEHRTTWYAGSGLFSDWKDENEKIWRKNSKIIARYTIVEPLPFEPDEDEAGAGDDDGEGTVQA